MKMARTSSTGSYGFLLLFSCLLTLVSGSMWFKRSSTPVIPPPVAGKESCSEVAMSMLKDLDRRIKGSVTIVQGTEVNNLTWSKPTPVPLAVVRPANEDDVSIAVPILADLKRIHGIDFRVKSGGHHYNAYSSVKNGIVLDLGRLNSFSLDEKRGDNRRTAWIGPAVSGGAVWSELVRQRGTGVIMGGCPAVNQGGFILGGGFSYWSRLYGLGCDRLRQARVVLADGTTVIANSTNEHKDLFWALRGAGSAGVGGVVTAFQVDTFETQDQQVYGLGLIETVDETARFMSKMNDATLPGNVGMSLFLFPKKYFGPDFVSLYNWYDTGIDNLHAGMETLNSTFHQMLSEVTANRFGLEMKSATEQSKNGLMDGRLWQVWNGFLMPEKCTPAIIAKLLSLLKEMRDLGDEYVTVEILLWGGAISKVDSKNSAFYWRRGRFNVCVNLGVPAHIVGSKEIFERQRAILNKAWRRAERYMEGCYFNYPMREASLEDYFGRNVGRLRRVKKIYDPDNVFSHPQSF
mmetsp:Transcript_12190/g.26397  ORF Transcript_12190/g.26397 Transcript_12190/m.26397 type:complete len:518 (+) Transcript_12190:230-1783(+)|eukprot:CAMPEP_0172545722 /NCGR_PEP_ID=MMETSP1067-20121228/15587_1 /TAXON_ID=265564 ORGANISM="Thalassiosira punctigera, Strain Tpunct2005C2" /NCGR_SAMPLE_ID=MMETSP1067 /ASSEMBLY_ACC=CAM_ASM_000444 /LENGTH=517 /DNA_ID=CAMNT_0013332517 /DNA_START=142 /DNA_END=1695 /DNA_ORIENTATION=+